MAEPASEGLVVERVDWLPSGGRSGLVRVRGRWPEPGPLPDLLLPNADGEERHASLPDPRAARDPTTWRGAYVVPADVVAGAGDRMALVFASGVRVPLPAPEQEPSQAEQRAEDPDEPQGGEVVDRAVLAERRARRAEAAEQAQARIAREALRAVEVLELRAGELEERLEALQAGRESARAVDPGETDELRARAEAAEAQARATAERLAAAEAELARARRETAVLPAPLSADRRVERLRSALAGAVVTIGELRVELHEARLRRRTADLAHGADAVRLAALAAEREQVAAEVEALRRAAAGAAEREDDLRAAAERAEEAHAATRRELAERVGELGDRLAAAEGELEQARAEVERLEAEVAAAETASQLAEAAAAAAIAERQAAEVAWASVADELAALRAGEAPPSAVADPAELAELARSLRREPAAPDDQLVADLDAAAAALRRAPDPEPPAPEPQAPGSDPLQPATSFLPPTPERPAPFGPDRPGPRIVSPAGEPPTRVHTARGRRDYPPLRGALVKLAHDDPQAAAGVLAGLLPAQGGCITEAVDYDLTITELGTYAITSDDSGAHVRPVDGPRRDADFHLRADALTLAEMLAGVGPRPRRFGRAKLTGRRRRRVRALQEIPSAGLGLADALDRGAVIDPVLALRCLAYAVHPSWTEGETFSVAHVLSDTGEVVRLTARDGRGLTVTTGDADGADATVTMTREAFAALLRGTPARERPSVRGDHRAVDVLRAWADRARRGETA